MSLEKLKQAYKKAGLDLTKEEKRVLKEKYKDSFVVQEHFSKLHHFDLRLEMNGVFKSWALPKGLPEDEGVVRKAIKQPDHSIETGVFEGKIPEGEYGAGDVKIIDQGKRILERHSPRGFVFVLNGKSHKGRYALFKVSSGENNWLIKKLRG